jgi:hypothetical protein
MRPRWPSRFSVLAGRKKLDVVLCRYADDLLEVGHLVQLVEELLELPGRCHPEEKPPGLVARVAVAVGNALGHLDQRALRGRLPPAVELHLQPALVHEDELVLRGVNVRRHERPGRVVGLERERGFRPCAVPVGVAENLPPPPSPGGDTPPWSGPGPPLPLICSPLVTRDRRFGRSLGAARPPSASEGLAQVCRRRAVGPSRRSEPGPAALADRPRSRRLPTNRAGGRVRSAWPRGGQRCSIPT